MSTTTEPAGPLVFPLFLIIAGPIGVYASWELTVASYLVVVFIAHLKLDVVHYLF